MFAFTKLTNHGSSHPIQARIAIFLYELIQKTDLTTIQKDSLSKLSYDLAQDLIEAEKYGLNLLNDIKRINHDWLEKNNDFLKNQPLTSYQSLTSPKDILIFLKNAKSSLRKVGTIIGIIFEKDREAALDKKTTNKHPWYQAYKKGNFQEILNDLKKQLKADLNHPLPKIIQDYSNWLEFISFFRDEDEHPKTFDDFIQNYKITRSNDFYTLAKPQFQDGTDVELFLEKSLRYLLLFSEEICILSLLEKTDSLYQLLEIAENDRDKACPKKFKFAI
ncbi:MAG: hypothetical protein WC747_01560 [Candidatus Babeliales bacterium]|jgi:hypothetical protein